MIFFLKDMGRKLWLSSGETGCVCQVVRDHFLKEFLIHCSASARLAKGSASELHTSPVLTIGAHFCQVQLNLLKKIILG